MGVGNQNEIGRRALYFLNMTLGLIACRMPSMVVMISIRFLGDGRMGTHCHKMSNLFRFFVDLRDGSNVYHM